MGYGDVASAEAAMMAADEAVRRLEPGRVFDVTDADGKVVSTWRSLADAETACAECQAEGALDEEWEVVERGVDRAVQGPASLPAGPSIQQAAATCGACEPCAWSSRPRASGPRSG